MLKVSFLFLILFFPSITFGERFTEEGFFTVCEKYKKPEMVEFWKECQRLQKNKFTHEVKERLRQDLNNQGAKNEIN